jgi:hypothetical protein
MYIQGFTSAILSLAFVAGPVQSLVLRSESSPNPIASLYPDAITGTLNSTIAVVPIPYTLARSIIPAQYGILKKAYLSLLPGFPEDKYPVSQHYHS